MRFTYAEEAAPRARAPRGGGARRGLTVILVLLGGLATWQIAAFAVDYWRALNG